MNNLINKDGSLKCHDFFSIKGHDYKLRVIGTSTAEDSGNTVDSVKNLHTGKVTDMTRVKLSTFNPYIPVEDKEVAEAPIKVTNKTNQNTMKLC